MGLANAISFAVFAMVVCISFAEFSGSSSLASPRSYMAEMEVWMGFNVGIYIGDLVADVKLRLQGRPKGEE